MLGRILGLLFMAVSVSAGALGDPSIEEIYASFDRQCLGGSEGHCIALGERYGEAARYDEAGYYYKLGCELDAPIACHRLGALLAEGNLRVSDFDKAYNYLLTACELKFLASCWAVFQNAPGVSHEDQRIDVELRAATMGCEVDLDEGMESPVPLALCTNAALLHFNQSALILVDALDQVRGSTEYFDLLGKAYDSSVTAMAASHKGCQFYQLNSWSEFPKIGELDMCGYFEKNTDHSAWILCLKQNQTDCSHHAAKD